MVESIQKKSKVIENIEKTKIFAVVRTKNAQKAIDISKALIDGGLKIIEVTMSYSEAPLVISELSKNPEISVAAGSVITGMQAESAIAAGADLITSPVTEINLIKLCKDRKIHIITGSATANEAYNAWKLGVNIIKIFPAKALGGPNYIKDILTPMPFLHLAPTGGVNLDNFTEYLEAGAVAVGMGKTFYADETSYSAITKKAQLSIQKLNEYLEKSID
jgi:2-dehydro-3-deoxyphosphogluconate aldolase/(4S)-4-hydroxy-2-oxoglutarate aldolase